MYHVAVIGAGQLGSRHLQGLSLVNFPCIFYMVDPFQESLLRARQRMEEMPPNDNVVDLIALTDIDGLPKRVDLAILATTADIRLTILEQLLSHCKVSYLVLEKVLFQREIDYVTAGQLLESHGAKAWVNCPRRMYDIYRDVKHFFSNDLIQYMQVHGGDWGLGCNGIHFADLFNYLTGEIVGIYDATQLNRGTYPSKRAAFVEFGGSLSGQSSTAHFSLTAQHGSNSRHLIMIRGEKHSCLLDEQAGQIWFLDEINGWHNASFTTPYQSQITGNVAMEILQSGSCYLPDYNTSVAIHLPFIRVLNQHLSVIDVNVAVCPIT